MFEIKFCKHVKKLHASNMKRVERICNVERAKKQEDELERKRQRALQQLLNPIPLS